MASKLLPLSVFTGKPEFYQALHFLDDVILRCRPLLQNTKPDEQCTLFTWYNRPEMSKELGVPLSDHEYKKVVAKLEVLRPLSALSEISALLAPLSPNLTHVLEERVTAETIGAQGLQKRKQAWLDEQGRPVGLGARKTATATVILNPLTSPTDSPRFHVNDLPMHRYFHASIRDRFRIAKPFLLTDSFDRMNAWVRVEGGGLSGQAGAVALGLARALAVFSPDYYKKLEEGGALTRDPRIVERKKPGQEKARKKFTWVKR